ncbi:MAG: NAD(P)/FAD-dependent oxidoreductase [Deltaproteobacteria bacterium]|nr:NAD(P)/FAD-dependent oxidoreductase [Deltaproteobacteria bacterium]
MQRFDLCVIGGGPAGLAAVSRAWDLGKRAVLIERDTLGGRGLSNGALSSKTLWHLSNDFARARRTDRGYRASQVTATYDDVIAVVREALAERLSDLEQQLAFLGRPTETGASVTKISGTARFLTPHSVEVKRSDGTLATIDADFFLVATGSVPRVPQGVVIDGARVVTSDHIEQVAHFPKSMVIVGAGVVGCEYATIFANFGQTQVNIIDRQPRILPFEDEDVADAVSRNFERMGIRIHRESSLQSLAVVDDHVRYVVCDRAGRECEPIDVEHALVSIGRVPNTRALGLEAIGVQLDKNGAMVVDVTQSSVPHIHGAGDVTADVALVNVAELEARHAVERMFAAPTHAIRYDALSAIYFLAPEVAAIGLNEQEARKRKIPYRVSVVGNRLVPRTVAMRATDGFVKILVSCDSPAKILGMRVVGPQAATTIQGIAFLIEKGGTLDDIDACVHPHPAVTEGVQECARALLGRSVLKPAAFGPALLRVDAWAPSSIA